MQAVQECSVISYLETRMEKRVSNSSHILVLYEYLRDIYNGYCVCVCVYMHVCLYEFNGDIHA